MPKANNNYLPIGSDNQPTDKKKARKFLASRLNNYLLWTSVLAMLTQMSLNNWLELPQNFESIATSVLNILVLMGILNNPTTESQSLFVDEDGNGIDDRLENKNL